MWIRGRLNGGRAGCTRTPVVCLHGVPASSFLYRKLIVELAARGLRGIAFDLPGSRGASKMRVIRTC
jgi:pimeloyl-ACP methyl ester carboxylesterase